MQLPAGSFKNNSKQTPKTKTVKTNKTKQKKKTTQKTQSIVKDFVIKSKYHHHLILVFFSNIEFTRGFFSEFVFYHANRLGIISFVKEKLVV